MAAAAVMAAAADAARLSAAGAAITAAGATAAVVASVAAVAAASALGWAAVAAGGGVAAAGAEATGAGVTTVGTGAVGRTELRFAPSCINRPRLWVSKVRLEKPPPHLQARRARSCPPGLGVARTADAPALVLMIKRELRELPRRSERQIKASEVGWLLLPASLDRPG
jgi:hypothetical protein